MSLTSEAVHRGGAETAEDARRERPILFSGPMVRAILGGSKTQTRRVIKPQPRADGEAHIAHDGNVVTFAHVLTEGGSTDVICPYGTPGDRLWVRETFRFITEPSGRGWCGYDYKAERDGSADPWGIPWRPSIHMPREACRLVLEVTDVRVQRLREISDADALAEGVAEGGAVDGRSPGFTSGDYMAGLANDQDTWSEPATPREGFAALWDGINGKRDGGRYGWLQNPWVWVVTFRKVEG